MEQLKFLEGMADEELVKSFLAISTHDVVLQNAIKKSTDLTKLVNSLLASIICIKSREEDVVDKIGHFLKSHPDIENTLELKEIRNQITNR